MSRGVLTVGSTMRIPLLYRGEYSQWVERFMNYLEEQTDGEAMINSIKNGLPNDIDSLIDSNKTAKDLWDALARHMLGSEYGEQDRKAEVLYDFMNFLEEQTDEEAMINLIKNGDQPLPRVTQVSIAGTSSTEQPPLKDKSMWSDQEKQIQKINRLARSLLIQGLLNDIYSLIDSNKTAKDLWDAFAKHMLGSEYDKQDKKDAVFNYLKKCGYSKDNCELNFKFLNNLQPEWNQYATMMTQNKNLMDINIDALYNILKQNQGDVNDAMGLKKKIFVVTSDPLALIAEKTKVSKRKEKVVVSSAFEGSDANDFCELKKITALLAKDFNRRKFYFKPTNKNLRTSSTSQSANKKQEFVKTDDKKVEKKDDEKKRDTSKKDKDEQVLLAEDQAWMESRSDSDQEINANIVFMAQIGKVLSDSEASSSSRFLSSLKPYVPTVILEKIIIDLEDEVVSLLEKGKANLETIESLKTKGFESSENAISESENQSENYCQVVEKECDNVENSKIVQICLWIIDSGCSKHMTGNRALLTNFVEKFLGTVRFGNNYFLVIAGYGDVVIGSMTIKKVYFVEGLGHILFSVGQFCDKGLEVAFQKSTCFVRNEDGVDFLTGDQNLTKRLLNAK
nr:integrase, catalytic region, zinc finger, CCHC-type, peptidase aspartic, catalytic [Tanacetum cinerariifolium]